MFRFGRYREALLEWLDTVVGGPAPIELFALAEVLQQQFPSATSTLGARGHRFELRTVGIPDSW